jgi:hypothetical protein
MEMPSTDYEGNTPILWQSELGVGQTDIEMLLTVFLLRQYVCRTACNVYVQQLPPYFSSPNGSTGAVS